MRGHREQKLLFLACMESWAGGYGGEIAKLRERRVDWRCAAELAVRLGCATPFARCAAGMEMVDTVELLRHAVGEEQRMRDRHTRLLHRVLDLARGMNIPCIPLKGSDPRIAGGARRHIPFMLDVDVLVRPDDAERFGHVLERNGCIFLGNLSPAHMNFCTDEDEPLFLEVHWDLVNRVSAVHGSLFAPSMENVWERATVKDGMHVLSDADLVCHSAVHAAKEGVHQPKWLVDIACAVERVRNSADWDVFGEVVTEWAAEKVLAVVLTGMNRVLGEVDMTLPGIPRLSAGDLAGRYVAARLVDFTHIGRMRPVVFFAAATTWRAKLAVVRGFFEYMRYGSYGEDRHG